MTLRSISIPAYLGLIVGTNFSFSLVGPVLLTFVLAGLTLAARDFVQDFYGKLVSVGLVVVGAFLSALLAAPMVALASFVAFLLAETLDLLLYTPTRARFGRALGVLISGISGSVVDSFVFLTIAFGSLDFLGVQVVGKIGATLCAAAFVALVGGARRA